MEIPSRSTARAGYDDNGNSNSSSEIINLDESSPTNDEIDSEIIC